MLPFWTLIKMAVTGFMMQALTLEGQLLMHFSVRSFATPFSGAKTRPLSGPPLSWITKVLASTVAAGETPALLWICPLNLTHPRRSRTSQKTQKSQNSLHKRHPCQLTI